MKFKSEEFYQFLADDLGLNAAANIQIGLVEALTQLLKSKKYSFTVEIQHIGKRHSSGSSIAITLRNKKDQIAGSMLTERGYGHKKLALASLKLLLGRINY